MIGAAKSYETNRLMEKSKNLSKSARSIIKKYNRKIIKKPMEIEINGNKTKDPAVVSEEYIKFLQNVPVTGHELKCKGVNSSSFSCRILQSIF